MEVETPRIFFSYARVDSEFVLKLAKDLRSAGMNIWVDQLDIQAGDRWDRAVEEALKGCPSLLVVLSPTSVASQNVMDEVSFGLEQNKKIVPVCYRNCDIPFRLKRLQRIDFTVDYHDAFARLLRALNVQLSQTAPPLKLENQHGDQNSHDAARADDADPNGSPWKHRWVVSGASAVLVVLGIGVYLASPWQARELPAVSYQHSNAQGRTAITTEKERPANIAHTDKKDMNAEYIGTVKWMKLNGETGTTRFSLVLHRAGIEVSGEYSDGTGDSGSLKGRIDGNSLDMDIVSHRLPGRCPLRGTLSDDASKLDAIYHCGDGERGEFSVARK